MSMKEWAKKEVELACKHENPDRKEGEFDYGCAKWCPHYFWWVKDSPLMGKNLILTK